MNKKARILEQELYLWLTGIQEDDPLPYEIANIYFIVEFSNDDIALSYSGSENDLQILDYGFYCPLEAEYFFSEVLKELAKLLFCTKSKISKLQVKKILQSEILSVLPRLEYLKNKKVYFGERFKKKKIIMQDSA